MLSYGGWRAQLWAVGCLLFSVASLQYGCVATVSVPAARGVVVSGPPPAPIVEERPLAPGVGSLWVAGYWHWTGLQYTWIPGHWEARPPPGVVWVAPRYVRTERSYFYEPGGWRRP
jgi:YXWGXW repeat-containing protein